jgi:hypothetical protein
MVRRTEEFRDDPLQLVINFARHYTHGPQNQYDHLYMFHTNREVCDSLLMFGGRVYRTYGGWCWYLGKRAHLQALCKLLEPYDDIGSEMRRLLERMKE